jgi:hypothetical protein
MHVCSASFMSKMIMVDSRAIKFQIWDTAGTLMHLAFGGSLTFVLQT